MIGAGQLHAINADPALLRWGRFFDADILIEVGDQACRILVRDGQITAATPGPFMMPSSTVALRAEPAAWALFMQPEPPPGYHDLLALVRRGALRVEGDLRPFMQHLFWFKRLFETLREQTPRTLWEQTCD